MDEIYPEEQVINSLIGPGSKFKGDLDVQGLVRVDGDYSGSITTPGKVLIGKQGRLYGTVSTRVIVVGGIFRGNIYAKTKIIILSDAVILGNLYAPRLIIEEGAIVSGYLGISGTKRTIIKKTNDDFSQKPMAEEKSSNKTSTSLFGKRKMSSKSSL